MTRGRFIVLEGLDGAGTTTQTGRLAAGLRALGQQVHETQQPSDGWIGQAVRLCLRGERTVDPHALALLFAADRMDHVLSEIEPALARGTWVLCDRYVASSWVYQGLHCDPAWVRSINAQAPWPDLTLLLQVDPELAAARVAARGQARELFDELKVQRRVAAGYAALATDPTLTGLQVIDGTQSMDQVTAELLTCCRPWL